MDKQNVAIFIQCSYYSVIERNEVLRYVTAVDKSLQQYVRQKNSNRKAFTLVIQSPFSTMVEIISWEVCVSVTKHLKLLWYSKLHFLLLRFHLFFY